MIGQKKLTAQIDDLVAQNKLPRFSIVVGERGMEHEDVAAYISLALEDANFIRLQDAKVDTIREMIRQAYRLHHTTVFCIPHADDMSANAKNAMLKVVEDAPNKAYFVMCLEDLSNTLATIQSRGIVFKMYRPTREDIEDFARSLYVDKSKIDEQEVKYVGQICSTVGEVLMMQRHGAKKFYQYAEYVAHHICEMDGAKVFSLSDRLALKDEEDKYDCRLFLKALQLQFWEMCTYAFKGILDETECNVRCSCNIARCIGRYMSDLKIKGINRGMLMDQMFLEMRKIWKSQM